jgi:glycosyltransferase involved in cell wall biosynthesis
MSQPTPKTVSTTVDVVIPVLNEAHVLEKSVDTVRRFLGREFEHSWKLVLVDN